MFGTDILHALLINIPWLHTQTTTLDLSYSIKEHMTIKERISLHAFCFLRSF